MKNNISKKARVTGFVLLSLAAGMASAADLTSQEQLGQLLYFDTNLSDPNGQACVSCHTPVVGFVDPDSNLPVSEGVVLGMFGGRNTPSSGYAMFAPMLQQDLTGTWIGGQFWDGRATGNPALDPNSLGDPLADQALGPFTNPVEMHNPDRATVIADVAASAYAALFQKVTGIDPAAVVLTDPVAVDAAYEQVALAIGKFERTAGFAQFTSKYDAYLADCVAAVADPNVCPTGLNLDGTLNVEAQAIAAVHFTPRELEGMQLFMNLNNNNDGIPDPGEGAMCAACHVADWAVAPLAINVEPPKWMEKYVGKNTYPPVFTDFTFDNLGVPVNQEIAILKNVSAMPIDNGLGAIVGDPALNGAFKVM
ncbi:MAG: cytochrome c peroxidase, partial [Chromatiales bacterium]